MWRYIWSAPEPQKIGYVFKLEHSYDMRKREAERLLIKHSNKVPLIVEKSNNNNLQTLENNKFLIERHVTIGKLLYLIRSKINLKASESIYLFVNNDIVPATGQTIGEVYDMYKDDDKFLYVTYSPENSFG
jgi:GABA(A) receptor-associated protein